MLRTTLTPVAAACIGLVATGAVAEPVEVLRNNGPDENRINIAILGDGYTAEGLVQYSNDVERLLAGLFSDSLFADYAAYFNVRRVDVTSNESGVDHPAQDLYRDTALGAYYDCDDIPRQVCYDDRLVNDVLDRSLAPNARDIVMMLVNDDEFGGSGGPVAVASIHRLSAEIMLHEVGHSFGLLADEYFGGVSPTCDNTVEPPEVNVTRESMATSIKWGYWIDPGTPVPAGDTRLGVVSAYEGAKWCHSGLYRPTYESKMRILERPFEQVNAEQLILRIYNLISPIDAVSPTTTSLKSEMCELLDFRVETPGDYPPAGTIQTTWSINGEVIAATGNHLVVDSCRLPIGSNRVEIEVRDVTDRVRRDPDDALAGRFGWDLETRVSGRSVPFTDDPVLPGVTAVRAVHFTELRSRIDGVRIAAGLTPFGWTDPVLRAGVTPVRLVHLLELRRALAAAYTASGRTPPRWTDAAPTGGATPIRAAHLTELRAAVVTLE